MDEEECLVLHPRLPRALATMVLLPRGGAAAVALLVVADVASNSSTS
jgi:hypothetical protein